MSGGEYLAAHFTRVMQVIEIDDTLAIKASIFAKTENKSLSEFVNLSLRETLIRKGRQRSDADKIKQFADSYQKFPEQFDDYEIWQDEQVWGDE